MALIEASRLLLAYGIDYAARVRNGYVSSGTGGHARPLEVSVKALDLQQERALAYPRVPARPSLVVLS
jgi:hypothetical protein